MIKLNNDYQIGFDTMNVILYKKHITGEKSKNQGEEYWEPVGYFGKFKHLIAALLNNKILLDNPKDIQEIKDLIEKFENDILNAIVELKPDTTPYGGSLESNKEGK